MDAPTLWLRGQRLVDRLLHGEQGQALTRYGREVRADGPQTLDRTLRLTVAAVVAFVVAQATLSNGVPVLAPLTALLVVQVTLVDILKLGVQRVISVVAGVLVATAVSEYAGFTWWSLAIMLATSLLLGHLLRLGDNLLEVPISAMIILAAGAGGSAASDRIVETLVGAAVGLAVNLLAPPKVPVRDAADAVRELADDMAQLLRRTGEEVRAGLSAEQADELVASAVRLAEQVGSADRELVVAERSRRLNVRAITVDPVNDARLRSALDVLEHTTVALRALYRAIADRVRMRVSDVSDYSEDARAALGSLLSTLADAVQAFGALAYAEVVGGLQTREAELSQALEALREGRAFVTELLLVQPTTERGQELWELNGAILSAVQRVLRELDVQERSRLRGRLQDAQPRPTVAVELIREASRQVRQRPRRRERNRSPRP